MRKFAFKLKSLLDMRKNLEETARRDHAAAQRRVSTALERVREQERLISEALTSRSGSSGRVDIDEVVRTRRWAMTLQGELESLYEDVSRAREYAETTRKVLVHASRQRQVMTRLEEKQREQWRVEQLKIEQAEVDEVAAEVARRRTG